MLFIAIFFRRRRATIILLFLYSSGAIWRIIPQRHSYGHFSYIFSVIAYCCCFLCYMLAFCKRHYIIFLFHLSIFARIAFFLFILHWRCTFIILYSHFPAYAPCGALLATVGCSDSTFYSGYYSAETLSDASSSVARRLIRSRKLL